MSWLRRRACPTEADQALVEARARRKQSERRAAELEPMLKRLETYKRENYIAEAVEETLRRRRG